MCGGDVVGGSMFCVILTKMDNFMSSFSGKGVWRRAKALNQEVFLPGNEFTYIEKGGKNNKARKCTV